MCFGVSSPQLGCSLGRGFADASEVSAVRSVRSGFRRLPVTMSLEVSWRSRRKRVSCQNSLGSYRGGP